MARDYKKYTVEGLGENLNKRQLVFAIVKDWAAKNKPSLEEIQTAFPTDTQGSKGFIVKASEVKDAKRFNMEEPLSIKNGTKVVVSNQWGSKNIDVFISVAEKLGYSISILEEAESTNIEKSTMKSYIKIRAYSNENYNEDFLIASSCVVKTNGEFTLTYELDSDGDGVIDTYHFYDIKTNVRGLSGTPWDFEEFTDIDDEWTKHDSLGDFGFDSDEIANTLESMRWEFIKNYLNEESQTELLSKAAVPFNKRDIFKEEDDNSDILVFEEGDINILPPNE